MNDTKEDGHELHGVEELLARYRPARPPASLQWPIAAGAAGSGRGPVIGRVGLAAALAVTVLQWATTAVYQDVTTRVVAPSLAAREAVVDAVARSLGDGARARQEAERLVLAIEQDWLEQQQRFAEVKQ